jgi:hypothetical protein
LTKQVARSIISAKMVEKTRNVPGHPIVSINLEANGPKTPEPAP